MWLLCSFVCIFVRRVYAQYSINCGKRRKWSEKHGKYESVRWFWLSHHIYNWWSVVWLLCRFCLTLFQAQTNFLPTNTRCQTTSVISSYLSAEKLISIWCWRSVCTILQSLNISAHFVAIQFEMIFVANWRNIIVLVVLSIVVFVQSDSNEICSTFSGRRIYLDQSRSGSIQAVNVSASNVKDVRSDLFFYIFVHVAPSNSCSFLVNL